MGKKENIVPKYSQIEVQLSGEDGNVFSILGKVQLALKRAGISHEEIQDFVKEAESGDYNKALQTCMEWVTCH
jgi:hypothetical protein